MPFETGVEEVCIEIEIIDDGLVEDVESFIVVLTSTDGLDDRIILVKGVITIEDNDGELLTMIDNAHIRYYTDCDSRVFLYLKTLIK